MQPSPEGNRRILNLPSNAESSETFNHELILTIVFFCRFLLLICSIPALLLRPRSTSSKLVQNVNPSRWHNAADNSNLVLFPFDLRPLCLPPDPSSWTSNVPAVLLSPLSSHTPRPLSFVRDAQPSSASRPAERPDLLRAAHSGESKLVEP